MPEQVKFKNRRKRLIIARSLQFRYVSVVLLAMLFVALLEGFIVYKTIWNELLAESRYSDWAPLLTSVMKKADLRIMFGLVGSIAVMLIISIYMSHKIAGPIYRIKKFMVEAAKGDLSFELRLRKGDELTDLVDEFNLMVKGLRSIISQDREKVGGIMREAEETLMIVNRATVTADEKKQTADHLKSLIVKLKDITGQFKV